MDLGLGGSPGPRSWKSTTRSVRAIAPADQAMTGIASGISTAKRRSVRSSVPTWPPGMTSTAHRLRRASISPRCHPMTPLTPGARPRACPHRARAGSAGTTGRSRAALDGVVDGAEGPAVARSGPALHGIHPIEGVVQAEAIGGQQVVVTVTEGEGRRGEGGVLARTSSIRWCRRRCTARPSRAASSSSTTSLAPSHPELMVATGPSTPSERRGRRSGHLEALGSEQDGAHGFVGWSVGVSGRGP